MFCRECSSECFIYPFLYFWFIRGRLVHINYIDRFPGQRSGFYPQDPSSSYPPFVFVAVSPFMNLAVRDVKDSFI